MAKGTTIVTKGVRYTDKNGKRYVLEREDFNKLIKRLARKAKIEYDMRIIEEMDIEG